MVSDAQRLVGATGDTNKYVTIKLSELDTYLAVVMTTGCQPISAVQDECPNVQWGRPFNIPGLEACNG